LKGGLVVRIFRLLVMVGIVFVLVRGLSWAPGTTPGRVDDLARSDRVQVDATALPPDRYVHAAPVEKREQRKIGATYSSTAVYTSYLALIVHRYKACPKSNDPLYVAGLQWALETIKAPCAWLHATGHSVPIAIVDSGIDLSHPDLVASLWVNPGETAGNGYDDDDNGYVDDVYGWDFSAQDNEPWDENGHGTHVAGIAGATTNNGTGIAGMMWGSTLLSVRVLDRDGQGTTWSVAQGIRYAADRGARVINLSLGGYNGGTALRDAVVYAQSKGALIVAAAGNHNVALPFYPAAYGDVIGVSATDINDQKASFSNYGSHVDVAAPGVDIYSTVPGASYDDDSGTSMAAPLVSGLAALIWAKNPSATTSDVATVILNGSQDLGSAGWDPYYGWGRINAANALDAMPGVTSMDDVHAASSWEIGHATTVDAHPFSNDRFVPGELIVRIRDSVSTQQAERAFAAQNASIRQVDPRTNVYLLQVPRGQESMTALALRGEPNVMYAHPNYILSAAR
jgi:subtilisin family serine protease